MNGDAEAVRHERKGIRAIRIDADLLSERTSLRQLHRTEANTGQPAVVTSD
jgi:hypothetical protein